MADFGAADPGQHAVEDDDIELALDGDRERGLAVAGDGDQPAFRLEAALNEIGDPCLVFDDEDSHATTSSRARFGSHTVTASPRPGSVVSLISPSWASTIALATGSPSPAPLSYRLEALLPR